MPLAFWPIRRASVTSQPAASDPASSCFTWAAFSAAVVKAQAPPSASTWIQGVLVHSLFNCLTQKPAASAQPTSYMTPPSLD